MTGLAASGRDPDVVVVGGGHNALVAAAYLGQAGLRVLLLEARDSVGGAVEGVRLFHGLDARLSRFSYLVSLFPVEICRDLGLALELRSRRIASYTPGRSGGLLVEREPGARTRTSFRSITGSDSEWTAWTSLEERLRGYARTVAPTLTRPLPSAAELRTRLGDDALWSALTERPLGELLESVLSDDTVRGLVLTDALIGTSSWAADPSLRQNVCFTYHVIGGGTGEWRVPVGGMGEVAAQLTMAALRAGASIRTRVRVSGVEPLAASGIRLSLANGSTLEAPYVLAGCAPATLERLLGRPTRDADGSQTKVNLLLTRLPRLASGLDPESAFGGTLHINQGYARLAEAYRQAASGRLPDPLPCEVYCHSLTDNTILSAELRSAGWHTLTMFALHTPAGLFRTDPDGARRSASDAALRSLQSVLAEPLEDCLARDASGRPCVEVLTPLDVERELGMPGGHIFHGDLSWPWRPSGLEPVSPADRWGVATEQAGILLCGSGAVRGGAVSGLGGHNAAQALLERLGRR